MGTRLNFKRLEPETSDRSDPIVAAVTDVLSQLGGSAHRDVVIAQAAFILGLEVGPSTPTSSKIIAAFDRRVGEGPDDPRPFRLPFGPESRRWALRGAPQPPSTLTVIEGWRWRRRDSE